MKIYSTLTGQKDDFLPRDNTVTMYVCGVTVYATSHIGHAMSYLFFDSIRRYLEFRGYTVKHVQNFTDIDDKIITRANQLGITSDELTERFIKEYFEDTDALNIKRATVYPRATQEVPQIIAMVQGLIDKGFAYPADGDVYFRVKQKTDYGKLSHQNLNQMNTGSKNDEASKEHPLDFALWKGAKPGEPQWPSPWGPGRPGWHIECSAMSLRYLGETIDIHGGGQDLIFPHHENEIAQSEAFTGKIPFVRFWLHNGLLQLGEQKMSKSIGNLITIRELLKRSSADALRLFVLSSHYRSPLTYSEAILESAEKGVERMRQASTRQADKPASRGQLETATFRQRFNECMDDDFNTPQAVAVLFDLSREINRAAETGEDFQEAQKTLRELAGVLGFMLRARSAVDTDAAPFIELLITTREELRKAKQFALADKLRQGLLQCGITLEDTPRGTVWKRTL
jgi:cysteinyl-tRNA synthetase